MNRYLNTKTKETIIDILAEDLYNITGKELGYTNIPDRIKELYG